LNADRPDGRIMGDVALTSQEQNEMLEQVAVALAAATLDEWTEIRFLYWGLVDVTSAEFVVVRPDSSTVRLPPPRKATRLMDRLRPGMYQPGKGAWFTATYVVSRGGRYRVDFDYDNEPAFPFDLTSASFAKDLAHFPRDARFIPPWLQQRLEIAADWG
jgi:hypothetical protein